MTGKLPWMPWYPDKWLSDEKLRACSYAARGLWADILSLMHKNDRRGHLQLGGNPVSADQLARMTGGTPAEVHALLQELMNAGVPSVSEDGILFSRRMVRDAEKVDKCRDAGRKGGRPKKGDIKGHAKGQGKGEVKPCESEPLYSSFSSFHSSFSSSSEVDRGAGKGGDFEKRPDSPITGQSWPSFLAIEFAFWFRGTAKSERDVEKLAGLFEAVMGRHAPEVILAGIRAPGNKDERGRPGRQQDQTSWDFVKWLDAREGKSHDRNGKKNERTAARFRGDPEPIDENES